MCVCVSMFRIEKHISIYPFSALFGCYFYWQGMCVKMIICYLLKQVYVEFVLDMRVREFDISNYVWFINLKRLFYAGNLLCDVKKTEMEI